MKITQTRDGHGGSGTRVEDDLGNAILFDRDGCVGISLVDARRGVRVEGLTILVPEAEQA